jgi:carboxypeptidase PM20D1
LNARGVALDYLLDEGQFIADGLVPGTTTPVAMIGTAEKGWLTLELTTADTGGHSSMPPPQTAIGILATAIHRLEANPMPPVIKPPVTQLFEHLAPEMSFLHRMVFANLWFFGPLVKHQFARSPETNAVIRTTTAVTIAKGGTRDNMLPKAATAVVDFRIIPGESTASVTEYVRGVIDDPRVSIRPVKREEPSPVSETDSASFRTVATTIRQIFPRVLVAPGLVVA